MKFWSFDFFFLQNSLRNIDWMGELVRYNDVIA